MTGLGVIEWAFGALLTIAGAWAAWWAGKKSKVEAEATAEPRTPYEALHDRVMYLEQRDQDKDRHAERQAEQIAELQKDAAHKGTELGRLRSQVRRLAGVLSREVTPVLDWIDGGAMPPPPYDQVRTIRDVIRDLDHDT